LVLPHILTHHRSRFQITVGGWSAGTAHQMVGCSTYLRDEVGDILDVSAPAGDFMLTPSAPRFPWIAPGPASRPSFARRAQCADTATATSDGGPRRTVPLKIMRFARWASARQLQLRHLVSACGSRRHLLSPRSQWRGSRQRCRWRFGWRRARRAGRRRGDAAAARREVLPGFPLDKACGGQDGGQDGQRWSQPPEPGPSPNMRKLSDRRACGSPSTNRCWAWSSPAKLWNRFAGRGRRDRVPRPVRELGDSGGRRQRTGACFCRRYRVR
jgi:hypothetical protein